MKPLVAIIISLQLSGKWQMQKTQDLFSPSTHFVVCGRVDIACIDKHFSSCGADELCYNVDWLDLVHNSDVANASAEGPQSLGIVYLFFCH